MTAIALACLALIAGADDPKPPMVPIPAINAVPGPIAIVKLAAEGHRVKKGDIVAELDPSDLRGRLIAQEIEVSRAESAFEAAEKARMAAELALKQARSLPGDEFKTIEGEIALAKSDLDRATDRVAWSKGMLAKGFVSKATAISDELTLQQAKFDLDQAQTKRDVLKKSRPPGLNLEAEIASARSLEEEFLQQARLALERSRAEKLRRLILQCTVTAPSDGVVRLARSEAGEPIREGMSIRDRQVFLSIEPE